MPQLRLGCQIVCLRDGLDPSSVSKDQDRGNGHRRPSPNDQVSTFPINPFDPVLCSLNLTLKSSIYDPKLFFLRQITSPSSHPVFFPELRVDLKQRMHNGKKRHLAAKKVRFLNLDICANIFKYFTILMSSKLEKIKILVLLHRNKLYFVPKLVYRALIRNLPAVSACLFLKLKQQSDLPRNREIKCWCS